MTEHPKPPFDADEAATLIGFLERQRAWFADSCEGLSDAQLRQTLPPSSMTLGGMLKHLAYVEDYWFGSVVAEQPQPEPWASVDWTADNDWDWNSATSETGEFLRGFWAERVDNARQCVDAELSAHGAAALGRTHPAAGKAPAISLRWVLIHMVEEYAQHNGHADLIRESIDGVTRG